MFALPWYLTWFGHSLNQYRDVVRLYDYFLASPPLMPLYVATALVMHRRAEVFEAGCDMASVHCTLSQIPDDVNFEVVLEKASELHAKYPPQKLEREVKRRVDKEYVFGLRCLIRFVGWLIKSLLFFLPGVVRYLGFGVLSGKRKSS